MSALRTFGTACSAYPGRDAMPGKKWLFACEATFKTNNNRNIGIPLGPYQCTGYPVQGPDLNNTLPLIYILRGPALFDWVTQRIKKFCIYTPEGPGKQSVTKTRQKWRPVWAGLYSDSNNAPGI
eukprot:2934077-Rhodomonas_salina.3